MSAARKLEDGQFSNTGEALQAHIKLGEEFGDQSKVKAANDIRAAIAATGFSESALGYISESKAKREGGKIALASYNPNNGQTSLTDQDKLVRLSKSIGQGVRETTTRILNHEKKHKKADEVEGAEELNHVIRWILGEKAVHEVEESTASLGTTEAFDAYNAERTATAGHARKLGISLLELSDIKLEGDYKGLIEIAANSGLIENIEVANSSDYGNSPNNSSDYSDFKKSEVVNNLNYGNHQKSVSNSPDYNGFKKVA